MGHIFYSRCMSQCCSLLCRCIAWALLDRVGQKTGEKKPFLLAHTLANSPSHCTLHHLTYLSLSLSLSAYIHNYTYTHTRASARASFCYIQSNEEIFEKDEFYTTTYTHKHTHTIAILLCVSILPTYYTYGRMCHILRVVSCIAGPFSPYHHKHDQYIASTTTTTRRRRRTNPASEFRKSLHTTLD